MDSNIIIPMGTSIVLLTKTRPKARFFLCAPTGIRTPVVALKGLRPSPLDDGGIHYQERADFIIAPAGGQAF